MSRSSGGWSCKKKTQPLEREREAPPGGTNRVWGGWDEVRAGASRTECISGATAVLIEEGDVPIFRRKSTWQRLLEGLASGSKNLASGSKNLAPVQTGH